MRKIRLDVDALEVISFATDGAEGAPRGTVQGLVARLGAGTGEVDSCDETCWRDTCNPCGAAVGEPRAALAIQPARPDSIEGGFSCGASCYWICQESDFC